MNSNPITRRDVLRRGAVAAGSLALAGPLASATANLREKSRMEPKFKISLAAWSVHRMYYGGELEQIDMPEFCQKLDIHGLELVNSFFPSPQYRYCQELTRRAKNAGVEILLIMCDGEGDLSDADPQARKQAVRNHRKWLDIAQALGCHSIRCNTGKGQPGDEDAIKRCAESFAALCELARPDKINVLIENHWGLSSDPDSLMKVIKLADDPLLGTLPDFGNFPPTVDRYDAVRRMMPRAKAVSAKCHDFDEQGNEKHTDYAKMMKIVLDAGYDGWVGIEYEGKTHSELEGIKLCKALLERFQ